MPAIATKERPILFSGPMVRAILDGRKTMTRRVADISLQWSIPPARFVKGVFYRWGDPKCKTDDSVTSPYIVSNRLWVRETWAQRGETKSAIYKADEQAALGAYGCVRWRPSIHMPRWRSRIDLKITAVRVERLQEISAKDILAEGAILRAHDDQFGHNPISSFDGRCYLDLRSLWQSGWDKINGKRGHSWASNPWVWVVSFQRVRPK